MKKPIVVCMFSVLLAFAAGVVAERFWFAASAKGVEMGGEGRDAVHVRKLAYTADADVDEEDSEGVAASEEDEGDFVEAVPAESVKDDDEVGEAMVEEVRDAEDGLTDEERAEKFKRENPEEWARIQKRRREMMAALKKAAEKRQNFLDTIRDEYLGTEEQRRTHAEYVEALTIRAAARERLRKAVDEGKEPDAEDFRAINRADRVIHANAAGEKRTLQEAAARSMGFSGEDVTIFVEMLQNIEDATNVHGFTR